jgi:hypothetical protein
VVVWKRGLGRELLEVPPVSGLPPAQIDIRTAQEIDESQAEAARRIGRTGGAIASGAGLETEVLVVDEHPQIAVSETIVRVARERDCCRVTRRAASPPAPRARSSQPGPNRDPAGGGGMPESLIIAFVLIGISVGKDAHRPVERVPGSEIAADRDRVA